MSDPKATHIDYLHKGHLRVVTGESCPAWSMGLGSHRKEALCVSPSCHSYKKLYRAGLPRWKP